MTDSTPASSLPEPAAALQRLSNEQLAALDDDQKATFCTMHPADQEFFAKTFTVKDLPIALNRKKLIMLNNQENLERWEAVKARFSHPLEAPQNAGGLNIKDVGLAVAGAAGIGALAMVASDGTAQWEAITPGDLVPALHTEFGDKERTDFETTGGPDAIEGHVMLISGRQYVPALTISMTRVQSGTRVKVSDLTSEGLLEGIKQGGLTLLRLAQRGLSIWSFTRRGPLGGAQALSQAGALFEDGTDIAGLANDLRLKERAWATIKRAADEIERARQEQRRQEREVRYALEQAWDHYYNCPNCSVPFGEGDKECQVCGTERPPKPAQPDPRTTGAGE